MLIEHPPASTDGGPRLSSWSTETELLAAVYDRLGALLTAFVSANGGGRVALPPHPRPRMAVDDLRRLRRKRRHDDLVARVLPNRR